MFSQSDADSATARRRARANAHALNQIYRRCFAKVLVKGWSFKHELSISTFACVGDNLHHRVPFGHVIAAVLGDSSCQRDRSGRLLQSAQSNAAKPVFFVNYFSLFGDTKITIHCSRRCTQHSGMGLAAAATYCAAATVKQIQFDVFVGNGLRQGNLRVLKRPPSRCNSGKTSSLSPRA